jgi:phospholipid/cholesterol/gamma-HCH transport system substrate-binding protein
MAKPFKFRYANELAGGFVLLTLAVVVLVVMLSGKAKGWFVRSIQVTLLLPEQGSMGLKAGADVQVLGTSAGSVSEMNVGNDGRVQAVVNLRSDFARFVRMDSKVFVRKALGIGDAYVEIQQGKGAPLPPAGVAVLPVNTEGGAPSEMLESLIADLRKDLLPTIQQLRTAAREYTDLAVELRNPEGNLQLAVARFGRVAAKAESGNGLIARLLNDRELADNLVRTAPKINDAVDEINAVLKNLNRTASLMPELAATTKEELQRLPALIQQMQATLAEVQTMLKDLGRTTSQLPNTVKAVNRTVEALPSLVLQTQETLRQMQRLVEGAQRNWLVSPYMDKGTPEGRIAPERAGGGAGLR